MKSAESIDSMGIKRDSPIFLPLILHSRLLSDTPISLKFAAFPIHGCLPLQELGLSRF
jgi:hypothetical protein